MTSQTITDIDGDTLRVSLATPAEQFPNGTVIVRAAGHIDGESAAVRMTADQLRGMIDALDPPIDYADGGVTAAAIEAEVDTLDAKASRLAAFGRSLGYPPEWANAPAVLAWHRSDGRTEHDGTPGKPRIWSPDYRTTERWSTPSLRNVHWSDLVDVTPLDEVAPAGSYTRTEEQPPFESYQALVREARDAKKERDAVQKAMGRAVEENIRLRAGQPRSLAADDITDEMVQRARKVWTKHYASPGPANGFVAEVLAAALTEPQRPEGAEELQAAMADLDMDDRAGFADLLAERGVRVMGAES